MDTIDPIFSWPALALIVATTAFTQALKVTFDYALGSQSAAPSPTATVRSGSDLRKQHPVFNECVLPMVPLAVGVVFAFVIRTITPELLGDRSPFRYVSWGIVAGMLGDYLYARLHGIMRIARGVSRAG